MAAKPAPKKKTPAKTSGTIPAGTAVSWHYRGAIGHGTVVGVAKKGTTAATTKYRVREHDHHPGEPAILEHYGRVLSRSRGGKKK